MSRRRNTAPRTWRWPGESLTADALPVRGKRAIEELGSIQEGVRVAFFLARSKERLLNGPIRDSHRLLAHVGKVEENALPHVREMRFARFKIFLRRMHDLADPRWKFRRHGAADLS